VFCKLSKKLRPDGPHADVKQTVLDDNFWSLTARIACLLEPICTAIEYCEGDNVPVSVMPWIWHHISAQLNEKRLEHIGFDSDDTTSTAKQSDDESDVDEECIADSDTDHETESSDSDQNVKSSDESYDGEVMSDDWVAVKLHPQQPITSKN